MINSTIALCISLIEGKSASRVEHLHGKNATIGTILKGIMTILLKKVPFCLLGILKHLCATKCLKKYQRLQFYGLYVPSSDETSYIVKKCTVNWTDASDGQFPYGFIFLKDKVHILKWRKHINKAQFIEV